ncbi:dihydroneopterin aldolase [bacterium]|nr:dihydroneopterin aldolase [bacterium]
MDRVSLHGIDVYAHHGVHPAERELGQRFVIDVDLWADCTAAALHDDLAQALDYTVAHRLVRETAARTSFQLLEALAGEICRALLAGLDVAKVRVGVHKPHPPIPDFLGRASVILERDRSWLATARGGSR